jgi:hydrogenase expression/formation protein
VDLEGLANRLLGKGASEKEVLDRLALEIKTFKEVSDEQASGFARAVLGEVENAGREPADSLLKKLLKAPAAGATMHDLGVGCRGEGDFFVHSLIAGIASSEDSLIPPSKQDDAGAVEAGGKIVVAAIDGTHSRLSDFPFIAGFHVARAAMRDVMVKGAEPVALIDDLHLSDDGDVGKLFDFVAGIAALAELTGVPLISGSTLRTGGDMVIGTRMVSGVGCIGIAEKLLKRESVKKDDAIIMTYGSGGGTIATTAIYSGSFDVVKETFNVDFIDAAGLLFDRHMLFDVHAMLDVTNGGLRGDVNEVCKTAGVGMELYEEHIREMVNPKVLKLLEGRKIDYLGVSLDSLLIFCPQKSKARILKAFAENGIKAAEVGLVTEGDSALLDGGEFAPRFRESAYTEVKKFVGECAPEKEGEFKKGAEKAAEDSKKKMKELVAYIKGK